MNVAGAPVDIRVPIVNSPHARAAAPIVMRGHYGAFVRTRSVGAFRVAELDATVPATDVPEHTLDEAHFVLVLHGAYASTPRHMPESSDAPLLVFHDDQFHRSAAASVDHEAGGGTHRCGVGRAHAKQTLITGQVGRQRFRTR